MENWMNIYLHVCQWLEPLEVQSSTRLCVSLGPFKCCLLICLSSMWNGVFSAKSFHMSRPANRHPSEHQSICLVSSVSGVCQGFMEHTLPHQRAPNLAASKVSEVLWDWWGGGRNSVPVLIWVFICVVMLHHWFHVAAALCMSYSPAR